jgi:hypothetical protein
MQRRINGRKWKKRITPTPFVSPEVGPPRPQWTPFYSSSLTPQKPPQMEKKKILTAVSEIS